MQKDIVILTGVLGSGASYIAEYLVNNHPGVEIHGWARWHSTGSNTNIAHITDKIYMHEVDLMDLSAVIEALKKIKPTKILHLASTANVRTCFDTPLSIYQNNVMSTANLFQAVKMVCPDSIIQLCSTSEVYGNPQEYPMTEDHKSVPVNPYAASKASQEALAYGWGQSWGLKIIITRAFCYINPRRKDLFATSFAYQIAKIEAGLQDKLKHGNLDSIRTIMDVRDMAEAYWIGCEKCEYLTPYNIGGKFAISVGDFLEILKDHAKVPIICEQDKHLLRPKDVTRQVPDISKFYEATKWERKYTIEESVQWLLDEMRKEVKKL